METIGSRARARIKESSRTQAELAAAIGMTTDAFSRALSAQRNFSSIELANLADELNEDVYWLITGEPDPNRILVNARHDFDRITGHRSIPGYERDKEVLTDIGLAYRQGYPAPSANHNGTELPTNAIDARTALGQDFVRTLVDRIEEHFGIDVVRVKELSTAYSFEIGGRMVIAVPANGNWFRENWDIAHELGHFVLRHPLSDSIAPELEAAANAFAAELLLPQSLVASTNWEAVSDADLARLVWEYGVSTDALAARIQTVAGRVPPHISVWAGAPTQRLLRRSANFGETGPFADAITQRMEQSAARRFPLHLLETHLDRVASGAIGKNTLAWMLGINPDELEVDAPAPVPVDVDELAVALGL